MKQPSYHIITRLYLGVVEDWGGSEIKFSVEKILHTGCSVSTVTGSESNLRCNVLIWTVRWTAVSDWVGTGATRTGREEYGEQCMVYYRHLSTTRSRCVPTVRVNPKLTYHFWDTRFTFFLWNDLSVNLCTENRNKTL